MAKFCPKCGAGLDSALKFCTNCGTTLPANAAQPPPVQQQQPYIQPQYQQPQAYAQPQAQQPYAPAPAPPPAKKKSMAPLVIVAVVILGGLVAAGIFTKGFGLFGGAKGGAIPVSIITGENAALTQSGKRAQAAKEGAQLTAGSRLTTGADTCVYLKVDKDSLIKVNENSEISMSEITGDVLKFELVNGSVLINESGKEGRLHMTAGNSYLIVRGTFFTAKYDGDTMTIDLIEGVIDVATDSGSVTSVGQGKRVSVFGNGDAEVEALDVSNFDTFTMDSVMEFKDALKHGSLSETDFSRISDKRRGGDSELGDGGQPISDGGPIPEDEPIYDDSVTGVWGEAGGGGGGSGDGDDGGGGGGDHTQPTLDDDQTRPWLV